MGDSLSEIILFLQIAIQVAEALEGLFDARIIHKDIKPANILIHPQSHRVKLIDFSIASALPREMRENTRSRRPRRDYCLSFSRANWPDESGY